MEVLYWMQAVQNPFLDFVFNTITLLFNEFIIILAACWCLWCYDKDLGYRLGFTVFLGNFTNQMSKIAFRIPRPWIKDPKLTPNHIALESATGYSFPSGHTQNAVCGFGALLLYVKKRKVTVFCVSFAFLVALSRLYLRVHTLWDVLASIGLSAILVLLMGWLYPKFANGTKRQGFWIVVITIVLGGVLMIVPFLRGETEWSLVIDCYKTAGSMLGFTLGWFLEKNFICFNTEATFSKKTVRFIIGSIILVGVYILSKKLMPHALVWEMLRYTIVIFTAVAIMPYILKKLHL